MFQFYDCESTNIRKIGYSPLGPVLRVVFKGKGDKPDTAYDYEGVSREKFQEFLASPSKGIWFSTNVRGKYPATKIGPA